MNFPNADNYLAVRNRPHHEIPQENEARPARTGDNFADQVALHAQNC